MSNFSLEQLTEGIRARHLGTQNRRLVEKWSRTGLLRGLSGVNRENMACMLENQASQVLREQNTLASSDGYPAAGNIRGFSNVAFPIVRRVFGGLIANDLVSIQPMSLPSGLLFYLDYSYGTAQGGSTDNETYAEGDSLYNSPGGAGVQSGSLGTGGQYDLAGSGFSKVHQAATTDSGAAALHAQTAASQVLALLGGGAHDSDGTHGGTERLTTSGKNGRLIGFDPELSKRIDEDEENWGVFYIPLVDGDSDGWDNCDFSMVKEMAVHVAVAEAAPGDIVNRVPSAMQAGGSCNLRRLNELGTFDGSDFTANAFVRPGDTNACLKVIMQVDNDTDDLEVHAENDISDLTVSYVRAAALDVNDSQGDTLVVPSFESSNLAGGTPTIPEIDIKIEALAVTAQSRKLKAKWSPELAQDLNAYHSLDAEVELTQILSEQIALEIDREILNDLLLQGNGANLFWSRSPGKFVNKETGSEIASTSSLTPGPAFTGTVREWYETLTETIIDAANTIHRKTLRGSANFIVVGPDVATILESSVMYRPSYSLDGEGQVGAPMTIGADKVGTLSNRFTVYKDPYFPRNKILVGYKGGSYLETGYVYAPYVPLIVTPTIFQPEDFTPRKGVMTRYGKKMVRSDFYGTVTVMDMNVI